MPAAFLRQPQSASVALGGNRGAVFVLLNAVTDFAVVPKLVASSRSGYRRAGRFFRRREMGFDTSTLYSPPSDDPDFIDPIRDPRSFGAAFDHQLNLSANWISLPGVLVAFSTPAVAGCRVPVASKMSVRPRAIDGTSKFA
jgi:hypothetical protein